MPMPRIADPRWKVARRLGRALQMVYDSGRGWMAASVALLIIRSIVPLLTLYLTKLLIDGVSFAAQHSGSPDALRRVEIVVVLTGVVALVDGCCRSLATLVGEAQGMAVADHAYHLMQVRSVALDLEYYENADYHDKFHRAQGEATYRCLRVASGLALSIQNAVSVAGIAGLVLSFNWVIGLFLVAASAPTLLIRLRSARGMYQWKSRRTAIERQAMYLHALLTGSFHAKELRLFGLGKVFIDRYRKLREEVRCGAIAYAVRRFRTQLGPMIVGLLVASGTSAYIAVEAVHGHLSLGALVMYYAAFQRGQAILQELLTSVAGVYEDSLYLADIDDFLELEPKIIQPENPLPIPRPMVDGIAFNHVSFSYPGSTRTVMEDVSLTVRPGQVVALVGENGAGKTTLIKLLCRLYIPDAGTITLDGIDLDQFSTEALRREISVILQDYSQYNLSVKENIWLGDVNQPPDASKIAAAAQKSGIDEVIHSLPQSYETILGRAFQNGEELSVGEWQKLALARAFFRDSQIVVMDEPSSALDARAEYEIFKNLRHLLEGRAAILISHRLSTVKMADYIYVIEDGRIVESGSHDELIRRSGTYAAFFEKQAAPYR